ncbi:MAG: chloride channel protein [Gammaproteobacteria bacterium]|nr:chloride channel protein [Gammaproteobacteria bacterium]
MTQNKKYIPPTPSIPFMFCTLLTGVGIGFIGILLIVLLHFVQHIAYGYSDEQFSFLLGVEAASPQRRLAILSLCGVVAGLGWWCIFRYGKPLVSIDASLNMNKPHFPIIETLLHALLQIVTVALGSPLGREKAPREISALWACWLSQNIKLDTAQTKCLIACAAGAGLAAIYNVPLGGTLFTLETLLMTYSLRAILPALTTSVIAVLIVRFVLGNHLQYHLAPLQFNNALIIWSILASPILALVACWFKRITTLAAKKSQHNWQLPVFSLINFIMIGALAMFFPALLGNGKSPAQIEFGPTVALELSATLLALRLFITWSSLRAGAHGGILTPSLANGALLGAVLGGIWQLFVTSSHDSVNTFAIIGATAFLAVAQKIPLTAIVLMFEFTGFQLSFLPPVVCCVVCAVWFERYFCWAKAQPTTRM